MADVEQIIPNLNKLMSIPGMVKDLAAENKVVLGTVPLMAIALISPHHAQASESWVLGYIKDLGPEFAVSILLGALWGEHQFVRAKGKRLVYENLNSQRKQAAEQFEGAFTLMETSNPTTEAEAKQLNDNVVNSIAKKLDPRTPAKEIEGTIKHVVALYNAKDEIKEGIRSSSGIRVWYEVVKEGLQAAFFGFSVTSLANLALTYGIPSITQESVTFTNTNLQAAAQATRWLSTVPLFALAGREVLRMRNREADFYTKGFESSAQGKDKSSH